MTQEAIGSILRAFRSDFNARFELAKTQFPKLVGQKFLESIRIFVYPAADKVAQQFPEELSGVIEALFDACLELSAQEIFDKYPVVAQAWLQLLPTVPELLRQDAEKVIRVITNAAYNLNLHHSAGQDRWFKLMSSLGPGCKDLNSFLELGQFVSWVCGMAQFRPAALKIAKGLEPRIISECFEISLSSEAQKSELLQRMEQDPWLNPESALTTNKSPRKLKILATLGGFRGFGGIFKTPPEIEIQNGNLVVYDSESAWLILADCFGSYIQRISSEQRTAPKSKKVEPDSSGALSFKGQTATFLELAPVRASVASDHTLAVVSSFSHHVFLLGEV